MLPEMVRYPPRLGELLWEHDSSQVFLLYLCQLHSAHESYFMLLLFANQQRRASVFNNTSYQMSGRTQCNTSAEKKKKRVDVFKILQDVI